MTHWAIRALIVFATVVGFMPAVSAQVPKDRVHFLDPAASTVTDLEGDVVETAFGIRFTGADKKERLVPAYEVLRIDYGTLDPVLKQAAAQQENDKDPSKPLAYFVSKLKELPANAPEKTRRYLLFREAYWAGELANAKANPDDFDVEAKKAAEKMLEFIRGHKTTWEQWPLGRSAARLLGELGDWKAADSVLRELAALADAPAGMKADVQLTRIGYLLRAGDYPAAKALLTELEKDPALPTGPIRERLAIYKEALAALPPQDSNEPEPTDPSRKKKVRPTAAVRKIEGLIAASRDPAVRSVGYGVLGELYVAHNLLRDAMWSFLWVDTVYNQNRDEAVRALNRLIAIFELAGEKDGEVSRVEQFREKLPRTR